MTIVLVGMSVVIGCLLAYVNHVTEGPITQQAQQKLADGIKAVLCTNDLKVSANDTIKNNIDGKEFTFVVHKAVDRDDKEIGAAVESTTNGFGGDLQVLVGFDTTGKILGYTILQSSETPGLGQKADKWFQKDGKGSIIGMNPADKPLKVSKDGGQVDAITASTITSRAFLKAVNQAYEAYSKKTDGETGATKQEHKE